ncbi:hypothetical protein FOA52_009166 [Chlamydomonas sp. UWO 241]|nr:hypothetical protein FOA52_009166 [Chlamydomonas sp. UWO 241]
MGPCQRLEGKVALIAGGTAGIGLATAERLGAEGASVFICSRKQANVDEALTHLRSKGVVCAGVPCHVGKIEQLKAFVDAAVKEYGRIDCLIQNAAVNPTIGRIVDTPPEAIDKLFEINVKVAVLLVKFALPHMRAGASVVFISSITAFNPPMPIGMYAVSKTALLGLTKGLAAELGPEGIRVNCVAPGIVPTKFADYLVKDPELAKAQAEATYLGRLGTPNDMAAAVAYLVSDDASYVTGETLVVSGGMPSRL